MKTARGKSIGISGKKLNIQYPTRNFQCPRQLGKVEFRKLGEVRNFGSSEVLKSNPPPMKPIPNETNFFRGKKIFI